MLHKQTLQFSPEVIAASMKFRQGDIVHGALFTYSARFDAAVTQLSRDLGSDAGTGGVRTEMQRAIITTATCDLQEPKRIALRPFITAARVFDAATEFEPSFLGHIRRHRVGDILPLSAPEFQGVGQCWVADLRWEGTLERSVLVSFEPSAAFADEDGYLDFSRRAGATRSRVAISNNVAELVLSPLQDIFKSGAIDPDTIEEVRIRCTPTTVRAEAVELHLLISDEADPAVIREALDSWYLATVPTLPAGLTLIGADVHFCSEYVRSLERGTERVNFDDMTSTRG